METIVVGVDGSICSDAALRFAIDEAALRGARLRIVSAWEIAAGIYAGGFAPAVDKETLDVFQDSAQTVVAEALEEAKRLKPSLDVEGCATQGQPAEVLLEAARSATMLVVGNRGHGGFASLLLGSVSQQVVHHAHCPVMVVHQATHE